MADSFMFHILVLVPLLLQLAGLVFVVLLDPYVARTQRIIMLLISFLSLCLIAQNYVGFLFDLDGTMPHARIVTGIIGYCLRPLILVLFFFIIDPKRDYPLAWSLILFNAAVHLTALFSNICFTIDENNTFHRGPLGYTCHVVSALLLIQLLYVSLHEHGRIRKLDIAIPVFNGVLIIASVIADSFVDYREYPVSFLTVAIVSSIVLYYIWLHMQLVQEHEMDIRAEQRIQIMLSQIQPHFLYNTLSTIQALCRINPAKASETVGKFGTYLRQNLDSLDQTDLIPFRKELEHVKLYADIEMIRFPFISVEYHIEDEGFDLPSLSIQPLVENAIRHGVRSREDGLVIVRSWRDIDAHVISISDNGGGFDVAAVDQAEKTDRSHIGIRNVRERIEKMCGGTMTIKSSKEEGTSVTISIPIGKGLI